MRSGARRAVRWAARQVRRLHPPWGPQGFMMAVAMWSGSFGASLLLTPGAFDTTIIFATFRGGPVPEDGLGVVLAAHSIVTVYGLFRGSAALQAGCALVGGCMALWMGAMMLMGGALIGLWSSAGILATLLGLGCAIAVGQYGSAD